MVIKNWFTTSKIENDHPSEETLLKCVDGELSVKESADVRTHLETCWSCRLNLEKIEETISSFVELRQQIFTPLTQTPPNDWRDFNKKLKDLAANSPAPSKSGWFGKLSGFGNFFQIISLPPAFKQMTVGAMAAILIAAIFWQFVTVKTVSASELLDKSTQSQTEKILEVKQAVVYQKLRVSRQDSAEMNLELWRDTTRSRFRQNVNDGEDNNFNQNLWQILQENGFNPQQPLSAKTFADWRKTLTEKNDTVEKEQIADGADLLVLRTQNLHADSAGNISEAILKVRENDFHPVAQTLQIRTTEGLEKYDFTELDFQVLNLSTFSEDFFPDPVEPQVASVANPAPAPSAETNANTNTKANVATVADTNSNVVDSKAETSKVTASVDLEVEVLGLLNQAKADLGEQITVKRETDGQLYVRGIVESANRKNEILQSLAAVRNNPAVRIEIKTVDEAVAEQKNTPKPTQKSETIESQGAETATDSELLAYFKTEQAARQFGRQMMSHSSRAMNHAYALKRLVGQFKLEESRQMSPQARNTWIRLINSHARAFREETVSLQRELQPVFDAPNVDASNVPNVSDAAAIVRTVETLLGFASTNDQVVRSAFTLSSGNAKFSAIKTVQFWQSLKNAEALAAKLQSVK